MDYNIVALNRTGRGILRGGCFMVPVFLWEWVLRSRIFDSCSSSWNRGFHEFPIIMHVRLIRVGQCYGTTLNETESPVITWVQVLGSYW